MILFNAVILVDASPRVTLPVPLVPIVLLAATVAAWRARRTLAPAPSPALAAGPGPEARDPVAPASS